MNTTGILNKLYFSKRQKQLDKYATQAKEIQLKVFRRLVRQGKKTQWGDEHHYDQIDSYEQFRKNVHVNTYEELKDYIHKMREGGDSVLWPGVVRWYAKSSGTTNDKSKFIPVSSDPSCVKSARSRYPMYISAKRRIAVRISWKRCGV